MKLAICKVEGIDEPVKLISQIGYAVGASTNKVYAWGIDFMYPSVDDSEEAKEQRLDGVDEEAKTNAAQLVCDPILQVTHAFPVPYSQDVDQNCNFVNVKSTLMQTCLLTSKGSLMIIDHKNPGFNPDELVIKESFLKAHIV